MCQLTDPSYRIELRSVIDRKCPYDTQIPHWGRDNTWLWRLPSSPGLPSSGESPQGRWSTYCLELQASWVPPPPAEPSGTTLTSVGFFELQFLGISSNVPSHHTPLGPSGNFRTTYYILALPFSSSLTATFNKSYYNKQEVLGGFY